VGRVSSLGLEIELLLVLLVDLLISARQLVLLLRSHAALSYLFSQLKLFIYVLFVMPLILPPGTNLILLFDLGKCR